MSDSLQDRYSPNSRCFGCGPKNEQGLRIKSHVQGSEYVAEFEPKDHHEAFTNMLNGGIIGALLDCHSNWAAAHHLMVARGLDAPPCTVTADFHVKLKKPTPMTRVAVVAPETALRDSGLRLSRVEPRRRGGKCRKRL